MKEKLDLSWLRSTLDCGDNSCMFKNPESGGMRTNGGCRCFKDIDQSRRIFVMKMYHYLEKIRLEQDK